MSVFVYASFTRDWNHLEPLATGKKLVRLSLAFIRDLANLLQISIDVSGKVIKCFTIVVLLNKCTRQCDPRPTMLVFNVSVNSKPDLPPPGGDPRGFAHSSYPRGRVFAPLSCPGVCRGGVSNQSKSSIILKKSAIFALSLKQLSSSSFRMFIYARSEQCDLVPIYTIINTQRIRMSR